MGGDSVRGCPDGPDSATSGSSVGALPVGASNTITDVPGVRAGHVTVIDESAGHQTGVTAIVPVPWERLPAPGARAGFVSGNGFGKVVGTTQIEETGRLESPILLTGTLSTFRVADHLVTVLLERPEYADAMSVNPVVAETNDGLLSDLAARPITLDHVRTVVRQASTDPLDGGLRRCGPRRPSARLQGGDRDVEPQDRRPVLASGQSVQWCRPTSVARLRIAGREVGHVAPAGGSARATAMIMRPTPAPSRATRA